MKAKNKLIFNTQTKQYEKWGDILDGFKKDKRELSMLIISDEYNGFIFNRPITGIRI